VCGAPYIADVDIPFYYTEGIQIHGRYGYTEGSAGERYNRDAQLLMVGEGTCESQPR
jgi:alkylation response protein AidB-like acyl-CoA dehydrogenase